MPVTDLPWQENSKGQGVADMITNLLSGLVGQAQQQQASQELQGIVQWAKNGGQGPMPPATTPHAQQLVSQLTAQQTLNPLQKEQLEKEKLATGYMKEDRPLEQESKTFQLEEAKKRSRMTDIQFAQEQEQTDYAKAHRAEIEAKIRSDKLLDLVKTHPTLLNNPGVKQQLKAAGYPDIEFQAGADVTDILTKGAPAGYEMNLTTDPESGETKVTYTHAKPTTLSELRAVRLKELQAIPEKDRNEDQKAEVARLEAGMNINIEGTKPAPKQYYDDMNQSLNVLDTLGEINKLIATTKAPIGLYEKAKASVARRVGALTPDQARFQSLNAMLWPIARQIHGPGVLSNKDIERFSAALPEQLQSSPTYKAVLDDLKKRTTNVLGRQYMTAKEAGYKIPNESTIEKALGLEPAMPTGKVKVQSPDGKPYMIDEGELEEAEKNGWKKVQ
jgi:hypothetical protein